MPMNVSWFLVPLIDIISWSSPHWGGGGVGPFLHQALLHAAFVYPVRQSQKVIFPMKWDLCWGDILAFKSNFYNNGDPLVYKKNAKFWPVLPTLAILSRIYALFGAPFTGLSSAVVPNKCQISGLLLWIEMDFGAPILSVYKQNSEHICCFFCL